MNTDVVFLLRTLLMTVFKFKRLYPLLSYIYICNKFCRVQKMRDFYNLCFMPMFKVRTQMEEATLRTSPIVQDGTKLTLQMQEVDPGLLTTERKRRTQGWRRGKQRQCTCFPNCRTRHVGSATATKAALTLRSVSLLQKCSWDYFMF